MRRCYTRLLPLYVVCIAVVAAGGLPVWGWVVLGVGAGVWLKGLASVTLRIRRLAQDRPGR